jgi:LuxR family maltose regulon positive regulatory protein
MWLIRTKLEVPAPTGRLVSRQRLRRQLPSVLRARLALVHAPAGFGKTCLLAEWQRCLASQRVRTAWLSLDEDDSEPLQFMAYLTAALAAAGIDVGHLGPAAERGFPDVPVSSLVAVLNQAVQRSRGRTVVMLDDYHRLRGGAVDAVLVSLIQGLGSRVSFVIAARERPAFAHADRALRVTCVELAGDQLRFTLDETRALLERTGAVSEEAVQSIARGTDGWAIALAAARDWLASGWSAERVHDALARPAADLNRYVADQILESLAPAEREFLRRTAIVDRFSEPLAHALCGDLPVHDAIAALERKDLLVVIWDGNESWFRYHRLIAELASAELPGAAEPAGCRVREQLHRRAAEWFFEAGHHAEAVRHALATGDDRLLAELFERAGGWQLIVTGHVGLTRNALTFIPPEVMREYPRSQLARILMLAKSGRPDEAYREIERLRARHLPSDDELLEMEVELMRVGVDRYGDRACDEPYVARFRALFDRVPSDHTPLRAAFANMLCALQYERGELEAAFATGDEAVAQYRRMSSLFGEVFVYVHQGRALHEMGRLRDATSTLRQAWALARDTTGPNTETEAVAAATLAAALYESGDLEEADGLLATALQALEQGESWFDVLAVAYETAAAIALERVGPTAARAIAQRAREMAARRDLGRLFRFADLIDLQSHLAAEALDTRLVPILEASLSVGLATEVSPRLRLRMSLALARLALARGQAHGARESAVRLAAECKVSGHHRLAIHAMLVEALAANSLGESESAASAFDRAVNLAMHEGFQQVFRDFGDALRPLVEQAGLSGFDAHAPRVRDRFLQAVHDGLRPPAEMSGGDNLSDREREVLRLLAEGLSNKAIARALSVSDNTVKFHLKNLFTKLGVSTRTEAVHLAPSLSLPGARAR